MSVMKRLSMIFKSKANKALDKMEDPRETLDYSYQRQLEMLQKVRRGVADVATSRKRLELQINGSSSSGKLEEQGRKALSVGREDLAREALHAAVQPADADRRPADAARQAAGRGGEADHGLPAAAGQGRRLPHPEGDDQGHLHRGRGADQDRRGVLRHLRGDGRRRPGDPARRGQDGADAGPRRRHRRAARQRRARRLQRQPQRRHPGRARPHGRRQGRRAGAGPAQGRARPGPRAQERDRAGPAPAAAPAAAGPAEPADAAAPSAGEGA